MPGAAPDHQGPGHQGPGHQSSAAGGWPALSTSDDWRTSQKRGALSDRPWPLPPPGEGADVPEPDERGGGTAFKVVLLIGLLGVVTAAGIYAGRALKPTSAPPATTAATTTTVAPTPTPTTPKPPVVHTVTVAWGPLQAESFGHLPKGGEQAGAAVVGTALAVVGGTGSARVLTGPVGGNLAVVGALPAPRSAMQAFPAGRFLWVVGGELGGRPTDSILRIDPVTGRTRAAGTFEEPLSRAGVVSSGGTAYLAGGWTGDRYATGVLKFTPPSTVSLLTRLPVAVRSPAVALLGRTLYVAGGRTETGPASGLYAVDIDSGAVTTLGQLPQPVEGGVLVPAGTKLYLVGGRTTGNRASGAVISIDPATGSPTLVGRIRSPLVGAAAVSAGSRTLVVDAPSGTVYLVRKAG
jgi:hypothetical protein